MPLPVTSLRFGGIIGIGIITTGAGGIPTVAAGDLLFCGAEA